MFRIGTIATTIAAILVGAAIAAVIPAVAQSYPAPGAPEQAGVPVQNPDQDQIVLRRDGDRAVPFDPVIAHGDKLVLRRDGSEAVPFVAEINPQAGNSGFDWSYVLIGAGSALALMLLAAWVLMPTRRSRPSVPQHTVH